MKATRRFVEAFTLVHQAFGTTPAEIEEAKAAVRASPVPAEDGYYAMADMIRAGWQPLQEQASSFMKRRSWPSLDLREAA